ncbi:hypothetical protein CAEBREN_14248 [Caenorhabditis brenneri]|uniref:Uncharacterized protein n=1 Tax=Caenorhabditis brenneri TaxID=135651 RepID=G0N774_CAEBE|nr:hypothetical protein CAEBREN_14248 [Caenorhabditis brenneri]
MLVIEFLGFLWGAIVTIRGCIVIIKTCVFNRNMNIVLCGVLMLWMENLIGRLLIMPYQKGWIQLPGNDPNKTYSEFFSNSTSDMFIIESLWKVPCFSIGAMLLTHYMVFAVIALTGITVERSLATYWINDYEKKNRPGISFLVLLALQLSSILIAYSAINILLEIYVWLATGVIVLVTNFVLFGYIWYWNIRVHKILDNTVLIPSKYSLQARFQAKENARSLDFTKLTVAAVSMALLTECVIFILQASNFFQDYEVILYYVVDFCNAGHPIVVIPLAMFSVPTWRKKFFWQNKCMPAGCCSRKSSPIVDVLTGPTTLEIETDQYFSQLDKAWA